MGDPIAKFHSVEAARQLRRFRARRAALLKTALFFDPAWDILLDLFIMEAEGRDTYQSGVSPQLPHTTLQRWVGWLVRDGFIVRSDHERDARKLTLHLTPSARDRMEQLLSSGIT